MKIWKSTNASDIAKFPGDQFAIVNLFDGDAFFGRLLCFSRGQNVPVCHHEHKDEFFVVIQGQETLLIDGIEIPGVPGTMVNAPVGIEHGLRADGSEQCIVRETVYARRGVLLLIRVALKRIKRGIE